MSASYNLVLVAVSACVAIAAAYIALDLSSRLFTTKGLARRFWLVGGAIAMGTGIWSMHFVAMLAFSIPIYVTYNLPVVFVSLILAILAAFQALFIVIRPKLNVFTLSAGSSVMGIGIALMHYSGMAAMRMPAMIHYQPVLFALSVLIAIGVSFIALKLFILFREGRRSINTGLKFMTACVMGGAVMSMHYTGMAAAIFVHDPTKTISLSGLDNTWLACVVCVFTLLVLGPMGVFLYSETQKNLG